MPIEATAPPGTPMSNHAVRDFDDDVSRTSAMFEALGLGPIDADENGCFVMSYDEHTSLHFQIVPGAGLLKLAVSVCTLGAGSMTRDLRVVLHTNLDVPRAAPPGTLSLVPSTRQVLFNTVVSLVVPESQSSARPMQAPEFKTLLERMLKEAFRWRQRLARDLHPPAAAGVEGRTAGSLIHMTGAGARHVIGK